MTTLRVAELDFDSIKTNFKEFLRTKPEFTDYDYEGSGLSVLMDLLAYNTHYNAVIANMLVQEMYLDTAVKLQSVSLIAKRLGYTPKSIRSARATVSMEVFPQGNPDTVTLLKNSLFSSRITYNQSFQFVNRDAITISRNTAGRYIFDLIELYEGNNSTFRYVVSDPVTQKFEIPAALTDTSLIRVYIQDSVNSTVISEWKQFTNIIDVTEDTSCFFVKLNENLKYEIYFGDGVIGKQLTIGNVVVIDYVTTNGPIANGASTFTFSGNINNGTSIVTTINSAYGGASAESIDDIKRNAQNAVLMQNRAVTESDYAAIISNILPVDTLAVYGGETITPPQYGKVFISVKLVNSTSPLTAIQKTDAINEIRKRSVLSLQHEFVDPEYTYIILNTQVKYNPNRTTIGESTLKTSILNKITQYGNDNLNKFNSTFEYSKLVAIIDTADSSVISNDTNIRIRKETKFVHNFDNIYVFDFNSPIVPSNNRDTNVISTPFRIAQYPDYDLFATDNNGAMRAFYIINNVRTYVDEVSGSIDYNTGKIELYVKTINILDTMFSITAIPLNKNVLPSRNSILTLKETDVYITVIA